MRILSRFALPTLLFSVSSLACAWHDTGHMVVAEIASRRLSTRDRMEIDRLLRIGGTDKTSDILTAACWADDFKTKENGLWHYINYHFRMDGKPTSLQPEKENVVWAIRKFSEALRNKESKDAEKAEALRFLLHLVGDIHMPLHTVARDTDAFPQGDRGGNDFKLVAPKDMSPAPRNLHFLWDMGGGIFFQLERPLSTDSRGQIRALADYVLRKNPESELQDELKMTDPEAWALEGVALSKSKVYGLKENEEPSEEYLEMVRKESLRRIALAGLRLGDLLREILSGYTAVPR